MINKFNVGISNQPRSVLVKDRDGELTKKKSWWKKFMVKEYLIDTEMVEMQFELINNPEKFFNQMKETTFIRVMVFRNNLGLVSNKNPDYKRLEVIRKTIYYPVWYFFDFLVVALHVTISSFFVFFTCILWFSLRGI
jgi:hypothetical protein